MENVEDEESQKSKWDSSHRSAKELGLSTREALNILQKELIRTLDEYEEERKRYKYKLLLTFVFSFCVTID